MWMLISFALASAVVSDGTPMAGSATTQPAVRSGRELDRAVHCSLRRWAKPTGEQLEPAARDFLALHDELGRDTKLAQKTRNQLSSKVRRRLSDLARLLRKQAGQDDGPDAPDGVDQPGLGGILPQRGPQGGFGRGGARRPQGQSPADAGADLIDLIERTISPQSWDINGGPGSIRYWSPGRALVVSAPQGDHDHVGRMLDQLRRMRR